MSWGDIFWIILILIVLFGCSTTGEVTRKDDTMKVSKFVELNTGTPSSVIREKSHTYNYEIASSARSEQFMVTNTGSTPVPPERALRLDLSKNIHSHQKVERILTIRFSISSWKIGPDEERVLKGFVRTERPREVDVTGYTCWLGSRKYNQWLALKRAKEVAYRLKNEGVKVRSVKGKGKCCYIDRKDPAPNRRAEVEVIL